MWWKLGVQRKPWGRCVWLGFFRVYVYANGQVSVRVNP